MKFLQSKTVQQTTMLLFSQVILVFIGFGIKTIQTKALGPEQYGYYATFTSVSLFLALFFRFGFFSSLQVLLAENTSIKKERELFGAGILVGLVIGICFSITLFALSFFIDSLFEIQIGQIIRILTPLCFIIPLKALVSAMSIGSNKIYVQPLYENLSKFLFFTALAFIFFTSEITLFYVILFNLLTLIISFGIIYRQLSPLFSNLKPTYILLWKKTKSFGFHFFLGSTANQSTFKLDEIFISYFINTTVNGFYSLASLLVSPLVMGSQSLSNVLFKKFSHAKKIPRQVFILNSAWLFMALFIIWMISPYLVQFLFGEEYMEVNAYVLGIGVASLFQGMYQPFNFLAAKSQGKPIRNIALIEAAINIIGNLALIPLIGVKGAIFTSILAKFTHLIGKIYYYRKYVNSTING